MGKHDYKQLLASSVFSGSASVAVEATVPTTVTDLFVVHERGSVFMIFQMVIWSGLFLEPFINSYVTQYSSWRMLILPLSSFDGPWIFYDRSVMNLIRN
jgi:hypothetical protein